MTQLSNRKIAFVDLTNKTWRSENTREYSDFIGGRGINQKILFSQVKPETNPLDPESVIILGAGPLVGTPVPAANRLTVDYKNALSGGVGSGNVGGHFPAEMRYAGFDHIIITGRSESPCYLFLKNGTIHFRDASTIWGKDTWNTEIAIQKLERERRVRVLCIGPAGENQVKFACLIADRGRAAAYGGSGAVFGSKNLKAVAAHGTMDLFIAKPEALQKEVRRYLSEIINKSEFCKAYREGGTLKYYVAAGENRPHLVRNFSDGFWSGNEIEKVSQEKFDEYMVCKRSCFNCPLQGTKIYHTNKVKCEGIQANTWRAFASNLTVTDPQGFLALHATSNLNGMDGDHTSSILAWAVECFEKGIINQNEADGLELSWGNADVMVKLINNIANRRGFGDILANGLQVATKLVGQGSEKIATLSHGIALNEGGMNTHRGWALGILTSTKAGGHLRGTTCLEFKGLEKQDYQSIFGIDKISGPSGYVGKAPLTVWYERYKAVVDIMGICYLPTMWMEANLFTPDDIARFYSLVTGNEKTPGELMYVGEKVQVIETLFNMLHVGFGRRDCLPPQRIVNRGISAGIYKGEKLDFKKYVEMLDEYYSCRNWDVVTGWPTKELVEKLGLSRELKILEEKGLRLPNE